MKTSRRKIIGAGLAAWATPVVTAISLPAHAQTSPCEPVTSPPLIGMASVGDNAGLSPIDPINVFQMTSCRNGVSCDEFVAAGLPNGLTISNAGIISGTYNANGDEFFSVDVVVLNNGCTVDVITIDLTITDEG